MTQQALNLCQQAFLLSHESNRLGDTQGTPSELAKTLKSDLTAFFATQAARNAMGGQWSLVWGPAVYQHQDASKDTQSNDNHGPDNVMYVAASPDQSVYVVAIAGTSGSYDLQVEDFDVVQGVHWKDAFPSLKPYQEPSGFSSPVIMSNGTVTGINNLLGMVDPATSKSLVEFLGSLSTTRSKTLIFAGHSLGGALAPTLALALFSPLGGKFNTANWGNVYVLPTAGATPGTQGLSEFFAQVFPPVNLNQGNSCFAWNQNIWNSFDVVPHAWKLSMLDQIPTIYPSVWSSVPQTIMDKVNAAKTATILFSLLNGCSYWQLPNIEVEGEFYGIPVFDEFTFMVELGIQHIDAYASPDFFGVKDLVSNEARSGLRSTIKRLMAVFQRMADKKVDPEATQQLIRILEGKIRKAG